MILDQCPASLKIKYVKYYYLIYLNTTLKMAEIFKIFCNYFSKNMHKQTILTITSGFLISDTVLLYKTSCYQAFKFFCRINKKVFKVINITLYYKFTLLFRYKSKVVSLYVLIYIMLKNY